MARSGSWDSTWAPLQWEDSNPAQVGPYLLETFETIDETPVPGGTARLVPGPRGVFEADDLARQALDELCHAPGAQQVTAFAPLRGGFAVPLGVSFEMSASGTLRAETFSPEPGLGTRVALLHGLKARVAKKRRGELRRELEEAALSGGSEGPTWTVPLLDLIAKHGSGGARGRARGNLHAPRFDSTALTSADPRVVSADARIAGAPSIGSIGFGQREATLWKVEPVDADARDALGNAELALVLHAGSVGYGRQVLLDESTRTERGLTSDEGRRSLAAFASAQNVAQANREVLEARIRRRLDARLGAKLGDKFELQPWIDQVEFGIDELPSSVRHRRGVLAPAAGSQFVLRSDDSTAPRWICRAHAARLCSPIWDNPDPPQSTCIEPIARLTLLTGFQSAPRSSQRD